ncbi:hypothetical protein GQ44DRAFT_754497 [Phaeosphaeriaceae sp. PMI808]|nr:hypothetical protein GQ44DRAFT_754497 [Phaeosphaeriaceae sp. PMI808]
MTTTSTNPSLHPPLIPSLQQPIAILATDPALGSPFLRAYPLGLDTFDFPSSTFLSFLDELNHVMVVSPPLSALSLVGSIVGLVPLVTAQIVGSSVNAAAEIGAYAMSKGRSELLLHKANKEIFAPRGLRADIAKLEVVAKVAQIPILNDEGKIVKDIQLLAPVETQMSGQERRLMALAHWTGPLELLPKDKQNVKQLKFFDRINTAASERQRSKEEASILEKRTKAHEGGQKKLNKLRGDYDKDMERLKKDEVKIGGKEASKPAKFAKELQRLEDKRGKVQQEYEEKVERFQAGKGTSIKKDKEEKAVRKILWLLIYEQHDSTLTSNYV